MKSGFHNILLFAGMVLALAVGCETTDYEPLIMKKKLKEMQSELDELKSELEELKSLGIQPSNADSGSGEKSAAVEKQAEIPELVVTTTPADETPVREALENADAFFLLDDEGYVVEADLLECSRDDAIGELPNFQKLSKVVLNGTKVTSETFDVLSKLQALSYLDIERSKPTAEDFEKLKDLPRLKFLQLFKATISEEAMKVLSEFPALEQIRCAQTRVGDAELAHLANLETLKAIDLSDCNRVTIEGIKSLAKCPKLAFLKVWGKSIDDECMKVVGTIKSLRVLGLNDSAVTDEGIEALKDLNLSEIHLFRTAIGDDSLAVLAQMSNMGHLNLRDTKITNDGIAKLVGLEKLAKLDLSECNSPGITDVAADSFAQMSNLTQLNLWSTQFTDKGVEGLTGLKKLTWLNLDNTKVTDATTDSLKSLPQLTWLHLGKTQISDESVENLMKLENLEYLNISYTKVSEDGYFDLDDHFAPNGCTVIQP